MQTPELVLLHHRLLYREHLGFSLPKEELIENPDARPLRIGCVCIDQGDDLVQAVFGYDMKCGGAPERGWARKTLSMGINEWGQLVYNGRFAPGWEGDWWYEKMVVNAGLFESPSNSVFTQSQPTHRFEAMAQLF